MGKLTAGAAAVDITPTGPTFLFGYPHVERTSTGVHDPLLASALFISDGPTAVVLIECDVIFTPKDLVARARARLAEATGLAGESVMISATHTHSGPVTAAQLSSAADPVVPPPDPAYLRKLEDGIVAAATGAVESARPARIGLAVGVAGGIGTNRRDPAGLADPSVAIVIARAVDDGQPIGLTCITSMHPTVLHEDSTLISADLPGLARRYLQAHVVGNCPVLMQTGPCGDQSPRHVVTANTFDEAQRLGCILGRAVQAALPGARQFDDLAIVCR